MKRTDVAIPTDEGFVFLPAAPTEPKVRHADLYDWETTFAHAEKGSHLPVDDEYASVRTVAYDPRIDKRGGYTKRYRPFRIRVAVSPEGDRPADAKYVDLPVDEALKLAKGIKRLAKDIRKQSERRFFE